MLTATRKPFAQIAPEEPTMALGTLERQSIDLDVGRVSYLRHGTGRPLLLVHGIPTSARLWEPLLGLLGEHYDCIVPDMLGLGRSQPNDGVDLSSPGQADMLAALLDKLGIESCHTVFHDQGGSHGGQYLKRHGQRVDAVLFTDAVCYDNWLVPVVSMFNALGRVRLIKPLAKLHVMQAFMRMYPVTHVTTRTALPDAILADWCHAFNTGGRALDSWIRYTLAQSPQWTLDAVPTLQSWDKPAAVVWAAQDEFLPPSWGIKLARDLPTADDVPVLLPFAGHFWQFDVPTSGAQAIHAFFSRL